MGWAYGGDYGSDWTRRRYSEMDNKSGVGSCLDTELGTVLSKSHPSRQHKVVRLSFARHASVIESVTASRPVMIEKLAKPFKLGHQPTPQPSFRDFTGNINKSTGPDPGFDLKPAQARTTTLQVSKCPLDIEAILDGSTQKKFSFIKFNEFLQQQQQQQQINNLEQQLSPWFTWASVMVVFLLEFRAYAERFSRLTPDEKLGSPHPFDIVCLINSGLPNLPSYPSLSSKSSHSKKGYPRNEAFHNPHHQKYSSPRNENYRSEITRDYLTNHHSQPQESRKVNWAPSVRSNHTPSQSPRQPHPRAQRAVSTSFSNLSSAVSSCLPSGLDPDSQILRPLFDALLSKYIMEPHELNPSGGLLLKCTELNPGLMKRAVLEGRYTNHPAVLGLLVEDILTGLNQQVIPHFYKTQSLVSSKSSFSHRIRTLFGVLILLGGFALESLLILSPSPLGIPFDFKSRLPRTLRLLLFPILMIGFLLISSDQFGLCCLWFWTRKSGCSECSSRRQIGVYRPRSSSSASSSSEKSLFNAEIDSLEISSEKKVNPDREIKQKALTWILASFSLSLIIQIAFLLIPSVNIPHS